VVVWSTLMTLLERMHHLCESSKSTSYVAGLKCTHCSITWRSCFANLGNTSFLHVPISLLRALLILLLGWSLITTIKRWKYVRTQVHVNVVKLIFVSISGEFKSYQLPTMVSHHYGWIPGVRNVHVSAWHSFRRLRSNCSRRGRSILRRKVSFAYFEQHPMSLTCFAVIFFHSIRKSLSMKIQTTSPYLLEWAANPSSNVWKTFQKSQLMACKNLVCPLSL
jgi:hypothetical protein